MMQNNPRFNIKIYHPNEIKIVALNIFPKGNTILHYAYKNLRIIKKFYHIIEEDIEKEKDQIKDSQKVVGFQIPFMKNFEGKTPLHICLENNNLRSADVILSKLKKEEIDSHARSI